MLYETQEDKINKKNYINRLIIFKATAKLQLWLAYGDFAKMSTFGIFFFCIIGTINWNMKRIMKMILKNLLKRWDISMLTNLILL